jgi:hypothetical protein
MLVGQLGILKADSLVELTVVLTAELMAANLVSA